METFKINEICTQFRINETAHSNKRLNLISSGQISNYNMNYEQILCEDPSEKIPKSWGKNIEH